jgi:hypothetical protein
LTRVEAERCILASGLTVGHIFISYVEEDGALVRQTAAGLEAAGVVDTIRVGLDPRTPAVVSGVVWVANFGDGTVSRIQP